MRFHKYTTKRGSVFDSSSLLISISPLLLFWIHNGQTDRCVVESFAQIRQQQPHYGWNRIIIPKTPATTSTTSSRTTTKDRTKTTVVTNNPRSIIHIVHDDTFQFIQYNLQAAIPIRLTPRHRDGSSFEHLLRSSSSSSSSSSATATAATTTATSSPRPPSPPLSYAERSRPYRRLEYTTESWVQHRSSRRFTGNLMDIVKTGIFKQLFYQVCIMTQLAIFVCCYNGCFINGYTDWYGMFHRPIYQSKFLPLLRVPIDFFTFTTPVLGLVLGKN